MAPEGSVELTGLSDGLDVSREVFLGEKKIKSIFHIVIRYIKITKFTGFTTFKRTVQGHEMQPH